MVIRKCCGGRGGPHGRVPNAPQKGTGRAGFAAASVERRQRPRDAARRSRATTRRLPKERQQLKRHLESAGQRMNGTFVDPLFIGYGREPGPGRPATQILAVGRRWQRADQGMQLRMQHGRILRLHVNQRKWSKRSNFCRQPGTLARSRTLSSRRSGFWLLRGLLVTRQRRQRSHGGDWKNVLRLRRLLFPKPRCTAKPHQMQWSQPKRLPSKPTGRQRSVLRSWQNSKPSWKPLKRRTMAS